MLSAPSAVPHVLAGEVVGLDGTRVWLDMPGDRLTLWAVGADRTAAHFDLAGAKALMSGIGEAIAAMQSTTHAGNDER